MTTQNLCMEKIQKPLIPPKQLDIIFRRRNQPNSQYYFTDRKPDKPHSITAHFRVHKSENILSFIKHSDRRRKLQNQIRKTQPLHVKGNSKLGVAERLYIEKVPDDVKCVVAIHPEFYSVIEGRPTRQKDDIKVYITNIRKYAMYRQQIGYRYDICIRIEADATVESRKYIKILKKFEEHLHDFQHFLTEDHDNSLLAEEQAKKHHELVIHKGNEMLVYATKLIILSNIIFKLDATRTVLKTYRKFCLFLAPVFWREHHDETFMLENRSSQFNSMEFTTGNDDLVESLDIDKIIDSAKNELKSLCPAKMYFKSPDEIVHIFRTLEMQSREYLLQLTKTYAPHKDMVEVKNSLMRNFRMEQEFFQWNISSLQNQIDTATENEQYLEDKFMRIVNGTFNDTVACPKVLLLQLCIQFVYESILGKCEEGFSSLSEPVRVLEFYYEDYNGRLDYLDHHIVRHAKMESYARDHKLIQDAYTAKRVLKEYKEMTRFLQKSFQPPCKFSRPVLGKFIDIKTLRTMARSERKTKLLEQHRDTSYKLTPDQRDALRSFTEWCEGEDPEPYLQQYKQYIAKYIE